MWHALKARWFWLLAALIVLVIAVAVYWRAATIGGGPTKPTDEPQVQLQTEAPVSTASPRSTRTAKDVDRKGVAPVAPTTTGPNHLSTWKVASTLPPAGTPYLELYAQLHDRAEHGDLPAARRLYRDAVRCNRYFIDLANAEFETTNPPPATSLKGFRLNDTANRLDTIQRSLESAKDACGGLTQRSLAAVAYKAVWDAARLGDMGAARCFVDGFVAPPTSVIADPNARQRFRNRAEDLMKMGLQRGDWQTVFLMQSAYGRKSLSSDNWGTGIIPNEPARVYVYVRLQWLGATDAGILSDIAMAQSDLMELGAELSPEVVATGNDRAQHIYEEYFQAHPYLPLPDEGLAFCSTGQTDSAQKRGAPN